MKFRLALLLILACLLPTYATALDLGPVKVDSSTRFLITNSPVYPVRVEEVLVLGIKDTGLWMQDLFFWDKAGLTQQVIATTPTLKVKDFPETKFNNRLALGGDLLWGLGPVGQWLETTGEDTTVRVGLAWRASAEFWGFALRSNASVLYANKADYHYHAEDFLLVRHESGFYLNDLFQVDWGTEATVYNNKLTVGYYLTRNVAVIVQRQDVTARDAANRIGVEVRF